MFNIDGKWFTSDNRRLWVFQKAEELGIVSYIDVYVTYDIDYSKFTTTSDGRYVRIRRNNPGGYLWQSLQRQMIEEHTREPRERQRRMNTRNWIKTSLICLAIVVLLFFLYWATRQ